MITCSVCGYPIMPNGCMHTVMGFTPGQWRERNRNIKMDKLSDTLDIAIRVLGVIAVFFVIACVGYAVINSNW